MCKVEPASVSFEQYIREGKVTLALASAIGRVQLWRMKKDGLPDFVRTPLRFLVERSLKMTDLHVVKTIEGLRADMAKRSEEFVEVFTDKISDQARLGETELRSLADVARISSVQPLWGTFLFLAAKARNAKTILELGGAAGISGCYLASSPDCERFITIEGSESRAQVAEQLLQRVTSSAEVIVTSFEKGIDQILPSLTNRLDLVYFDGYKQMKALLALLVGLMPFLNPHCLVIFDDIYWSAEMRETWKRICRLQGFGYAINVGRMGLCVWEGSEERPKVHGLFSVVGLDLYGIRYRTISLVTKRFSC